MIDEICSLGVSELARLYRQKELSVFEVVNSHLQRCERLNPILNAFIHILHESAMKAAKAMDNLFKAGIDLGPLQGIPISVKDIICVRGTVTTAGSPVLLHEPPDKDDAEVVQLLRRAGGIIIGKTNLYEFAAGDPDPSGPFGLVQNPRCIGCHPGSSSSGAGASVSAGLGVIAIGTDTGGSVRIPAYLCGVTGLKPTTGRISMEGIIPLSFTMDTVGPLGRRISDVAAVWDACDGSNHLGAFDQLSSSGRNKLDRPVTGWHVGVLEGEYFGQLQPEVSNIFQNTLKLLSELGCRLNSVSPQVSEDTLEAYINIVQAELAVYHEKYRHRDNLYGAGFHERLLQGREIKALSYLKARQHQKELQEKWLKLMDGLDVLVLPTGPLLAPFYRERTVEVCGKSYPFRAAWNRFTRPFNLLGWPALTLPNGTSDKGLPAGLQIVGPPYSDEKLLILGDQLERALGLVDTLGIEPR